MNGSAPESHLKRKWGMEQGDSSEQDSLGFGAEGPRFLQESSVANHHKKEWRCQIEEATVFGHSEKLVKGMTIDNSANLKQNVTNSCFNHKVINLSIEHTLSTSGACLEIPVAHITESSASSGNTSSCGGRSTRQLYSSKKVCSASSVMESEAMRKWKEIKQNGFLSHPNGGVPVPEPQPGKKSRKKTKGMDQKRKFDTTNGELDNKRTGMPKAKQDNRKVEIAKVGEESRKMEMVTCGQGHKKTEPVNRVQDTLPKIAPSGLLSRIGTGIIRRVKNHEEVHAVLEEMVRIPHGQA